MGDRYTSEELLHRAMLLLGENYDAENDSFFLVMTKDGKIPEVLVGEQQIIGELNYKTVVAFIIEAISQLCVAWGKHPYIFIVRHILSFFINQERAVLEDTLATRALSEDMSLDGVLRAFEAPVGETEVEDSDGRAYIINPAMDEVNN